MTGKTFPGFGINLDHWNLDVKKGPETKRFEWNQRRYNNLRI